MPVHPLGGFRDGKHYCTSCGKECVMFSVDVEGAFIRVEGNKIHTPDYESFCSTYWCVKCVKEMDA